MIMEAAPGQTLLDLLLDRPWRLWGGPAQMADLHARLHRLPPKDFPTSPGPFLQRHLTEMRVLIEEFQLQGLQPGLEWLENRRPNEPAIPSILHLDFHPVNLMFHQDRCSAVLDWPESDVGDRHADIASTIVLFKSTPMEMQTLWRRFAVLPGRGMLYRRYLRAYRRQLPLDRPTLAYYIAWAAGRRCALGEVAVPARAVPAANRPPCAYLSADRVACLCRLFRKWSGVPVHLEEANAPSTSTTAAGLA